MPCIELPHRDVNLYLSIDSLRMKGMSAPRELEARSVPIRLGTSVCLSIRVALSGPFKASKVGMRAGSPVRRHNPGRRVLSVVRLKPLCFQEKGLSIRR
jgi:hypothetical protein